MLWYLSLVGCNSDNDIKGAGIGDDEIVYSMDIAEPQYGAFYGSGDIPVQGVISPPDAMLLIEGIPIATDDQGAFSFSLPFNKQYELVDFELVDGQLRERIPVFSGNDPADTWPGGLTARLLPVGMTVLGEQIGAMIDETGWSETISAQLPEADWGWAGFSPVGIIHDPTVMALAPAEDGVAVDFSLRGFGIEYEFWYQDFVTGTDQSFPVYMVFDEVAIGATAVPYLDEEGVLIFSLVSADLTLDTPDVQFGLLDGWIAEWLLQQGWDWIIEPLSETLLDTVLAEVGSLEIGGPFAFETDMMGSPLGIELYDIYGDPDGLAMGLEMRIGDFAQPDPTSMPVPTQDDAPQAQVAVGIHEGLFQQLLGDQLAGLLGGGGFDLSSFGDLLGNGITMLPGGDDAPDGDGWCLDIDPGAASVVRMQEGVEPLALLYMPDMRFEVGIEDGGECEDWLLASLAAEVGIAVKDGSVLGIDIDIAEGAILYYGAEDYDEAEVVASLSQFLQGMLGLVGGFAEFDLGDILGGFGGSGDATGEDGGLGGLPMGDLSLSITDSTQLYDAAGMEMEGLFALSIDLWSMDAAAEEAAETE